MDNERVREFCLSLPHATEAVGWGHHLVFWVGDKAIGGKMFALIHLDDAGTGVLWFHCGTERYQELLEIEGIIPAPYMAKAHQDRARHAGERAQQAYSRTQESAGGTGEED